MTEHRDILVLADLTEPQPAQLEPNDGCHVNETFAEPAATEKKGTWRVEAGRKGAERIRELIRRGRQYEQEHGLKSGRQRLRQLIQEGKLYEQEHGLRPARRPSRRGPRMSGPEAMAHLFQALKRLVKPSVRADLVRVMQSLEQSAP